MKFTWNTSKSEKVEKDHKVRFEKLSDIFDDPFSVDFTDEEHSDEFETRYAIIGKTAEYGLVYLVYAVINETNLKFITARKAEKWMVNFYRASQKK